MKKILLYTPVYDGYYDIFPMIWDNLNKLIVPEGFELHMIAAMDTKYKLTKEMKKYIEENKIDLRLVDIDIEKFKQTRETNWIEPEVNFSEQALYRLGRVREYCRQIAIADGYDYFLSMDSDIMPPSVALKILLEADFDCIGGWTYNKKHGGIMIMPDKIKWGEIFEVVKLGIYFFLEKREVFEKFPFFVFTDKPNRTDDSMRNETIRMGGYKLYLHPDVYCGHVLKNGEIFTGNNYEK